MNKNIERDMCNVYIDQLLSLTIVLIPTDFNQNVDKSQNSNYI